MSDHDPYIHQLLTKGRVPEHREGFWSELEARMDADAEPEFRRPGPKRFLAIAAAAAVIAIGAFAMQRTNDGPTSVLTNQPTSTVPVASDGHREAVAAVTRFIDALLANDIAQAKTLIGPLSEQYLTETTGSIDTFLQDAAASYAAWKESSDRKMTAVEVRTSEFVVVITGSRVVDGESSISADAIPVRHAESADAWFVEPWAFDAATGGRIELVSPDPAGDVPVLAAGHAVEVAVPAPGRIWFGLDAGAVTEVLPSPPDVIIWRPQDAPVGTHMLLVVYQTEKTFTALARAIELTD